jgi:hypothetical protein
VPQPRNTAADEALSHVAIGVWENEGGALGQGQSCYASEENRACHDERNSLIPGQSSKKTDASTVRTWNAVVIFQRPFILDGFGDIQPAGAYSIATEEEKLSGLPADCETWHHASTKIQLLSRGAIKYISIDPDALVAALHRANAQSDRSSLKNTARNRLSTARRLNAFSGR